MKGMKETLNLKKKKYKFKMTMLLLTVNRDIGIKNRLMVTRGVGGGG